jgi:hypothetical protein
MCRENPRDLEYEYYPELENQSEKKNDLIQNMMLTHTVSDGDGG